MERYTARLRLPDPAAAIERVMPQTLTVENRVLPKNNMKVKNSSLSQSTPYPRPVK